MLMNKYHKENARILNKGQSHKTYNQTLNVDSYNCDPSSFNTQNKSSLLNADTLSLESFSSSQNSEYFL